MRFKVFQLMASQCCTPKGLQLPRKTDFNIGCELSDLSGGYFTDIGVLLQLRRTCRNIIPNRYLSLQVVSLFLSNNLYLNIIYLCEKGLYTYHFKIHPGIHQVLNTADRKICPGNGPALISLHSSFTHPRVLRSLTCTGFMTS